MKPELKRIEAALEAASNQYLPMPLASFDRQPPVLLSDAPFHPVALPQSQANLIGTNAALALSLLAELQTQTQTWMTQLQELLPQIQAVYSEGPIVAGWLESVNPTDPTQSQYRLCGLNADGQLWYRHCPHDQLSDISLAIVRYQRLQTLLARKQTLETLLGQLTESLMELHEKLANVSE